MAVKENWQQPRRRLLPPYGSRVSKNVHLCFPISPSLSKGHIKKGVGNKQLGEVILLQYICLFRSLSQQAVEVGALGLKYMNPMEEHGSSRASAGHSKLPSTTAPCFTSKVHCLCFWKAGLCSVGTHGMEGRQEIQAGCRAATVAQLEQQWCQTNDSGEQGLTTASISCLKK